MANSYMNEFAIKTPQQIGAVLRGYRTAKKLNQQSVGLKAALPQPVISKIESRLFKVLAALELELVVRPKSRNQTSSEW
jgi:hypothetical protein